MDRNEPAKLTAHQLLTIERLAAGATQSDMARELGIRPSTISQWNHDPAYRAALDAALNDVLTATRNQAKSMAGQALAVLRELMSGEDASVPAAVRRQAASDLLDRCGVTAARAIEVSGRDGGPVVVDVRQQVIDVARTLTAADLALTDDTSSPPEPDDECEE